MSLIYNGTNVDVVVYNGTNVNEVVYKNILVFDKYNDDLIIEFDTRNDVYNYYFNSSTNPFFSINNEPYIKMSPAVNRYYIPKEYIPANSHVIIKIKNFNNNNSTSNTLNYNAYGLMANNYTTASIILNDVSDKNRTVMLLTSNTTLSYIITQPTTSPLTIKGSYSTIEYNKVNSIIININKLASLTLDPSIEYLGDKVKINYI